MTHSNMLHIWFWYLIISFFINIIVVVWVTIGGVFDLQYLFKSLKEASIDDSDDGRVVESYTMKESTEQIEPRKAVESNT